MPSATKIIPGANILTLNNTRQTPNGTGTWSDLTNAGAQDSAFAYSSSGYLPWYTQFILGSVSFTSAEIPDNALPSGIAIRNRRSYVWSVGSNSPYYDYNVQLVTGTNTIRSAVNKASGAAWSAYGTMANFTYGSDGDLWGEDPYYLKDCLRTGIGIALSCYHLTAGVIDARVDLLGEVTVYYTLLSSQKNFFHFI